MAEILISHNLLTFLACYWHKFLANPKSCMPTMFPRLVHHQLIQSTQQHLDNFSCISPKWLKSWFCPTAVGCFGCADAAPAWGTLWVPQILDCSRTCAYKRPRTFAYNRPKMWVNFGLIQLTLPKCCWVLWLSWCCTSLGNIVGMTDELNFNFEL